MPISSRYGRDAEADIGSGVEDDRDGAVVDERDLHSSAEHAARDAHAFACKRCAEALVQGLRDTRTAAPEKLGRLPLRVSAMRVNWLTTSASPAHVEQRAVEAARRRSRRSAAARPCRPGALHRPPRPPRATPSRTTTPAPISATTSPATATDASRTRWTTARTGYSSLSPSRASADAAHGRA